ncbi:hypothetical protein C8F01DRAFT_1159781 [Mycena amicta]|nr:hypothetical protein C8F01DRAFT_1159781 [Mycena amicta]
MSRSLHPSQPRLDHGHMSDICAHPGSSQKPTLADNFKPGQSQSRTTPLLAIQKAHKLQEHLPSWTWDEYCTQLDRSLGETPTAFLMPSFHLHPASCNCPQSIQDPLRAPPSLNFRPRIQTPVGDPRVSQGRRIAETFPIEPHCPIFSIRATILGESTPTPQLRPVSAWPRSMPFAARSTTDAEEIIFWLGGSGRKYRTAS